MCEHDAFRKSGSAGGINQRSHAISTVFRDWFRIHLFIQLTHTNRTQPGSFFNTRAMPLRMLRRMRRNTSHINHTPSATVISNVVDLASRESGVCEHWPRVHPGQCQEDCSERAAVLTH